MESHSWWLFETGFFPLSVIPLRSIQVAVVYPWSSHCYWWLISQAGMDQGLFNCSPMGGHYDCFQFGAIINKAAVSTCVWVFVWTCIHFSGNNARSAIMVSVCFVFCFFFFLRNWLFSGVTVPLCTHTSYVWEFQFLCMLPSIWFVISYFSCSNRNRLISHGGLKLHFFCC